MKRSIVWTLDTTLESQQNTGYVSIDLRINQNLIGIYRKTNNRFENN